MNEALMPSQPMPVAALSREQVDLLKRTVAKGTTDDEFRLFLEVCSRRKVDPFSRLIYPVKRWDSKEKCEVMALQSSIDYFRLTAERTGKYVGQIGPHWCGDDGVWTEVWLKDEPPRAARCGVLRSDFKEPLYAVARWSAYVQTTKDGNPNRAWGTMGELMLGKCAEALAIRRAFPEDLAGLYTGEEMAQAENAIPNERLDPTTGEIMRPKPSEADRMQKEIEAWGSPEPEVMPKRRLVMGIPITIEKTWEQVRTVPVSSLNAKSPFAKLTLGELIDEEKADDGRLEYFEQDVIQKILDAWNRMSPKQKEKGLPLHGQLALITYDQLQNTRAPAPWAESNQDPS